MAATRRPAHGRQLLLLAALLFGIVTMHTLGHPTGHAPGPGTVHSTSFGTAHSTSSATSHSPSPATDHSPSDPGDPSHLNNPSPLSDLSDPSQLIDPSHPGGPELAAGRHEMSAGDSAPPGMAVVTGHARAAAAVGAPAGMGGMDPLSVCLAVLAALTLVLLLKAGLLRPGGFAVPARPLARLLDGLRPNPPPPRILLSHLSVLRI
ncbi:hypothetical protein [Streptomyces sp. NPDC002853]